MRKLALSGRNLLAEKEAWRGNCVAVSERQIRTALVDNEIITRLRNLHISEKGGN
jgi:hypothetical protein